MLHSKNSARKRGYARDQQHANDLLIERSVYDFSIFSPYFTYTHRIQNVNPGFIFGRELIFGRIYGFSLQGPGFSLQAYIRGELMFGILRYHYHYYYLYHTINTIINLKANFFHFNISDANIIGLYSYDVRVNHCIAILKLRICDRS